MLVVHPAALSLDDPLQLLVVVGYQLVDGALLSPAPSLLEPLLIGVLLLEVVAQKLLLQMPPYHLS